MNFSFWEKESFLQCDIAIVGSGIVGLSAAIHLKETKPSLNILLLDQSPFPGGASTRNAGFACFGSVSELVDDLSERSEKEVFDLVELRWAGLSKLRSRVGDKALQYRDYGGFETFTNQTNYEICADRLKDFNAKLKSITGKKETFVRATDQIQKFGFQGVKQLIHNTAEGQIHTGAMMKNLAHIALQKGIQLLNGIRVETFEDQGDQVYLYIKKMGAIKANKVLVATNGFTKRLFPDLKVQPARNQVLVTQPIPNLFIKGSFHYDKGYVYFRNIGNRILLGGGRNLTLKAEETDQFGFTPIIQDYLLKLLTDNILPNQQVKIEHRWSGIMGVGPQKRPIIKHLSKNVAIAVRLGGMGVAIGSIVGEQGADLILNGKF